MGFDKQAERAARREDQRCFICDDDIFSNTTRRLGNKFVCIPCLGSVNRLKEAFEEDLAQRAKSYFELIGFRPDAILKTWAEDFGIQLSE